MQGRATVFEGRELAVKSNFGTRARKADRYLSVLKFKVLDVTVRPSRSTEVASTE